MGAETGKCTLKEGGKGPLANYLDARGRRGKDKEAERIKGRIQTKRPDEGTEGRKETT